MVSAGITQAGIANLLNSRGQRCSRQAVNHVVRGLRRTPRIVAAICELLEPHGYTRDELFPKEENSCPPSI